MNTKTTLHYYKSGDFWRLEQTLDTLSAQGWQVSRPGRLLQRFTFDGSAAYVHRFGVSAHRAGSADDITYLSKQERAGWKVVARKGVWILFRAPAEEDKRLVDDREPIAALYDNRIKSREGFRMWMIVLASILMLAGYFTNLLPLLYSFALPMLLALLVTLQIKYMQEGIKH